MYYNFNNFVCYNHYKKNKIKFFTFQLFFVSKRNVQFISLDTITIYSKRNKDHEKQEEI